MQILLQSTAATVVGRGYLSSDHISTATGLDPAITISKNGGNFANPAAGASVMTEIEATGCTSSRWVRRTRTPSAR